MSASDSDTTSSSSVAAIAPSLRSASSDRRNPSRPRDSSYPRRHSSLSDARYSGHHVFPGTSSVSGPDGPSQSPSSAMTAHTRNILTVIDRKRRLTSSAQDHGRRRQGPTVSTARPVEHLDLLDAVDELQPPTPASSSARPRQEVVDLTGSSPPPQPLPPRERQQSRTSSSSSRRYVVPRWQPDSEVPECPICKRTFGWLFRRHHCRKCGRVVCNECSPHRITIPRQFIVNPPSTNDTTSPTQTSDIRVEAIDLTGDEVDNENGRPPSRYLGGGEKVRLCNPCVPDPQPEPLPNFPQSGNRGQSSPSSPGSTSLDPGPRRDIFSRPFNTPNRHRTGTLPTMGPPGSWTGPNLPSLGALGSRPRPSSFANSSMLPTGHDPRYGSHNVSLR